MKLSFGNVILGALLFSVLVLVYPFFSGAWLTFGDGEASSNDYHRRLGFGFYQQLPPYIAEAAEFLNEQKHNSGVVFLPLMSSDVYNWGYAGATPIAADLINRPIYFREYGEGMLPPNSKGHLIRKVYESFSIGSSDISKDLLDLEIEYVVVRHDVIYSFFAEIVPPQRYEDILRANGDFEFLKAFGEWSIFRNKVVTVELDATDDCQFVDCFTYGDLGMEQIFPSVFKISREPGIGYKRFNPQRFEDGLWLSVSTPIGSEVCGKVIRLHSLSNLMAQIDQSDCSNGFIVFFNMAVFMVGLIITAFGFYLVVRL
ncbi:alpha-(1-_3)-arabinofuranosyltransferase family protein [Litoricolaceae bacterium]|nr:alpha-(1->3)-arabinofuranosyltransferase family protein [Litorivicinaceae bacterium]